MNGQSSTIPAYFAAGTAGLTRGTSLLGHDVPRLSSVADVEARYRAERRLAAAEQSRQARRLRQERRAARKADRVDRENGRRGTQELGMQKSASAKLGKVLSGWTTWSSSTQAHRSSAEQQNSSACTS